MLVVDVLPEESLTDPRGGQQESKCVEGVTNHNLVEV